MCCQCVLKLGDLIFFEETLTNRGIISKDEWDRLSSFLDEMLSNDEGKITISENLSQNFLRLV